MWKNISNEVAQNFKRLRGQAQLYNRLQETTSSKSSSSTSSRSAFVPHQQRKNNLPGESIVPTKKYSSRLHDSAAKYFPVGYMPMNRLSIQISNSLSNIQKSMSIKEWGKSVTEKLPALKDQASSQIKSATSKLVKTGTETIVEPTKKTVHESSNRIAESVHSASSRSKAAASDLIQTGKDSMSQAIENTSARTKGITAHLTTAGQEAVSDTVRNASFQIQSRADRGREALSQSIESTSANFKSAAYTMAKQGKETLVEEFRLIRKEAMSWLWWWSLAAIAVYGLATTLPSLLLREYNRKSDSDASNKAGTRAPNQDLSSDKTAIQKGDPAAKSWIPSISDRWLSAATTTASPKNETESSKSDDMKSRLYSQFLFWPSFGSKSSQGVDEIGQKSAGTTMWKWPTTQSKETAKENSPSKEETTKKNSSWRWLPSPSKKRSTEENSSWVWLPSRNKEETAEKHRSWRWLPSRSTKDSEK